jgi:hypothetical protein
MIRQVSDSLSFKDVQLWHINVAASYLLLHCNAKNVVQPVILLNRNILLCYVIFYCIQVFIPVTSSLQTIILYCTLIDQFHLP